jgi:protoporphyrinogen oxidase
MTGLAAASASGLPVYERSGVPGGICASYYIRRGEKIRHHRAPPDDEAYRFEYGGGHWIWAGDPATAQLVESLTPLTRHARRAAVYFAGRDLFVPYPLQFHLRNLGYRLGMRILFETIQHRPLSSSADTLAEAARRRFGPTLCGLFFDPFHERYTAGLSREIEPQDSSKSPIELRRVIAGVFKRRPNDDSGYNAMFSYPQNGLDALVRRLSQSSTIHYGKEVVRIDTSTKVVTFSDRSEVAYESMISTLPLDRMLQLANLVVDEQPDPFTSVLVINIGAKRGARCPNQHWLYVPTSATGFHRVGFYSNVDPSFLPASQRTRNEMVGIYVEIAFRGGSIPDSSEIERLCAAAIRELQGWGWIGEAEVIDPTWIETAYTWTRPGSLWRDKGLNALRALGIHQVGRYAQWASKVDQQSIAHSIRTGLEAGECLREQPGP